MREEQKRKHLIDVNQSGEHKERIFIICSGSSATLEISSKNISKIISRSRRYSLCRIAFSTCRWFTCRWSFKRKTSRSGSFIFRCRIVVGYIFHLVIELSWIRIRSKILSITLLRISSLSFSTRITFSQANRNFLVFGQRKVTSICLDYLVQTFAQSSSFMWIDEHVLGVHWKTYDRCT